MAGKPNEYNTNTFIQYDPMISPNGPFMRFMNDPEVQEMIHVRGNNLPGLNFVPETTETNRRDLVGTNAMDQKVIKHDPSPKGSDGYYTPPHWQTCNDDINEGFSSDQKTQSVTALQYISRHIRVLLYR